MFGYLIGGRGPVATMQQHSPGKFIFLIENASEVHNFAVFLTDPNFPIGYGASIYLSWAPYTEWKYLGYINQSKCSAFFTLLQESDKSSTTFFESKNTVQVGISIETDAEIQQKVKSSSSLNDDSISFKAIDFKQFTFKMCHNLVNYILSFQGTQGLPQNQVPTSTIDRWYQNFQKKLQNDVLFWKDQN
eukprot:gene9712-11927_t